MTTLRQIEANRRNALLSTGPKTEEGRNSSKRNRFEHGMASEGAVRTEDERRLIETREDELRAYYLPTGPEAEWAVREAALMSVRLQRCATHDWALRMLTIERAETTWNDDRRLAAEEVGTKLAASPALVHRRLRRTLQGCEWLLLRWRGLAAIVRAGGDWNEVQEALALNLLGTPRELRDGLTPINPPRVEGDALRAERLALAEAEVVALEQLRDSALVHQDEIEQFAAASGIPTNLDHEILLLMRYEAASTRRMTRALDILRRGTQQRQPGDSAATAPATTAPPPEPDHIPHPAPPSGPPPWPFDPDPAPDPAPALDVPPLPLSLVSILGPGSDLLPDVAPAAPISDVPTPATPAPVNARHASAGNRRQRRARMSLDRRRSGA